MPRISRLKLPPLDLGGETIGGRLAKLRKARGYTQTELAAKIGIIQTIVSAVETNALKLSAEMAIRFAIVLGVSTDDFLMPANIYGHGSKPRGGSMALILNRLESCHSSKPITRHIVFSLKPPYDPERDHLRMLFMFALEVMFPHSLEAAALPAELIEMQPALIPSLSKPSSSPINDPRAAIAALEGHYIRQVKAWASATRKVYCRPEPELIKAAQWAALRFMGISRGRVEEQWPGASKYVDFQSALSRRVDRFAKAAGMRLPAWSRNYEEPGGRARGILKNSPGQAN
jgi:transcriptional regulator with XRE-family HTH domain